jgi:pyruvate/2-oxoglutarate dehydrogenase complex dihydrolipoamide dehydrogenase (E3) component
MAEAVQAVMESEGVNFYLGAAVEKVHRRNGGKKSVALKLEDGASVVLTADAVLVALGRSVNVEDLWLDAAGVDSTERASRWMHGCAPVGNIFLLPVT